MSEHVAITLQPSGGEKETVKAGVFDVADEERPLAQNHGAGYRAIYDLGRPERSVFVVSTGQSGNPLSSHYEDYAEPWRDGRYHAHRPLSACGGGRAGDAGVEAEVRGGGQLECLQLPSKSVQKCLDGHKDFVRLLI